jgi:hypothetical protein
LVRLNGYAARIFQFNTILNEPLVIIIKMRANTHSPGSVPYVNAHLNHEQPTRHSPKIISSPVVPVRAPPYAQDHAYTYIPFIITYFADEPQRAILSISRFNN